MTVLGIESSCDETSASIVENGRTVRSLVIASQSEIHARYHGVVPEVASRAHVEHIEPVVREALSQAGCELSDLDGIAVTSRPGLSGSLAVGLTFAKALAFGRSIPFVAVDHMQAHAYAARLALPLHEDLRYPYLVLLVSGGHSMIAVSRAETELEVLGTTIDDACGEVYDKVSVFLGAGYPGGPQVDRLAQEGDPRAFRFPVPKLNHANQRYDMSFSGLKTAVVHQLERFHQPGYERTRENVAAAFQNAAVSILMRRLENAIEDTGIRTVAAGGGVAANQELRARLSSLRDREPPVEVVIPPIDLCMDNGAMVAGVGYHLLARGELSRWDTGVSARVAAFRGTA